MTELPPEIGDLTKLQHLALSGNRLTTLPSTIGNLKAVTYVSLYENQVSTLPPEMGDMTGLTTLYLSSNNLTELPDEFDNLSSLETIDLSFNSFSEAPTALEGIDGISIHLDHNQVTALRATLAGTIASAYFLTFSDNQIAGDITAALLPLLGRTDGKPRLSLGGNGCMTTTNPELAARLTEERTGWQDGCPDALAPGYPPSADNAR